MFDICIIGTGIIGSVTATLLSKQGYKILCIEQNSKPLMSSSACGVGALTPYTDPFFSDCLSSFASESVEQHKSEILPFLKSCTGIDIQYSDKALLELIEDEIYLNKRLNDYKKIPNYSPVVLSNEEVIKLEPNLSKDFLCAIKHPEIWIDLNAYRYSLRQHLNESENITIICNEKVTEVVLEDDPVLIKVASGKAFSANKVVYCSGLHSDSVLGLPKYKISWVRGDTIALRTKDDKPIFSNIIYRNDGFITPRGDGLTLLGSNYDEENDRDSDNNSSRVNSISVSSTLELLKNNLAISNSLSNCNLEKTWRGWRPKSEDGIPIFGVLDDDRVIIATGFYGLGITMSAGVANAIGCYINDSNDTVFPSVTSALRF